MCWLYSFSTILKQGIPEGKVGQQSPWLVQAASCPQGSAHLGVFLPAQTLCRFESMPSRPYKLFMHINSWHYPFAPQQGTSPSRRCPAVPGNFHGCTPKLSGDSRPRWHGDTPMTQLSALPPPSPNPAPGQLLLSAASWHLPAWVTSWNMPFWVKSQLRVCWPTSGHTYPGHTLSLWWAAPQGWGANSVPSHAGHIPSATLYPSPHFGCHSPRPSRAGAVYIWDIFGQHQHNKPLSGKLLATFGSLNQKQASRAFSQGWLRWVLLFKHSSGFRMGTRKDTCLSCLIYPTVCRHPLCKIRTES